VRAGFAVTGWKSRERLAAPVAEIRDAQASCSRSRRLGPGEPLSGNHRQDHGRVGGRPRALGPALGDRGGQGAACYAEECSQQPAILRDQCAHPLGRGNRARLPCSGLGDLRQALSLGGHVRKGERGVTVVYADRFVPDDEKKRAQETGEEALSIPFLKRFTVFNVTQCENLAEDLAVVAPPAPEPGLIEPKVELLIKATGIDFRIGGDRGLLRAGPDYVQVPPPQAYFEPINTALHELVDRFLGTAHMRGIPARWADIYSFVQ
jgi:N-terminal domain of anti-restriction factor ArdC